MRPQLYLASRSPRRQALLTQVGLRFALLPAEVPEQPGADEPPDHYAVRVATAKARSAAPLAADGLPVLGADTDVTVDGGVLGKPVNEAEAVAMLMRLSGRAHHVYSAVAVIAGERLETALSVTRVVFAEIAPAAAAAYWRSGEPQGKAGAYAIQGFGARFVRELHGSYSGVMGLPLYETCDVLARFGVTAAAPAIP